MRRLAWSWTRYGPGFTSAGCVCASSAPAAGRPKGSTWQPGRDGLSANGSGSSRTRYRPGATPPKLRYDAQSRRLCFAHRRDGEACRGAAIQSGTVCRVHGGAAPQVKERAHEVLLADLIGPALTTLRDPIQSPDTPPAVRLRAAESILDRTGRRDGMPHPSAVQVGQWLDQLIAEEEARIARLESS